MDLSLGLGIGSVIITVIIGAVSFWFTYRTSIRASNDAVKMTKSISHAQIQSSANARIAAFRVDWIDKFRNDLSVLNTNYSDILVLHLRMRRHVISKAEFDKKNFDYISTNTRLRRRLLLMLNPDSDDKEEKKLESLLKKNFSANTPDASRVRKEILYLSRILLKREWDKAKSEIRNLA